MTHENIRITKDKNFRHISFILKKVYERHRQNRKYGQHMSGLSYFHPNSLSWFTPLAFSII